MMRVCAAVVLSLWGLAAGAQQSWGNLDALLFRHLTTSGTAEASFWLPDAPSPAAATRAIGVVYEYIPGSAGSTSIASGIFVQQGGTWLFAGAISGLFGQSPRDVAFGPGSVELTTTMLGPNEPRCCPTKATRWRIDLATGAAQPLN